MREKDVVIIGAGAAGLMCAISAGARGRRVALLDHAEKIGKKILISGGGRCNFTNTSVDSDNFHSHNAHFAKSALSRYTQWDFIAMVERHGIAYHEKKLGQLFCDHKASQIVAMLLKECGDADVAVKTNCSVQKVAKTATGFQLQTSTGEWQCSSVVIATGGLSVPSLGASGFGYEIALQFGLSVGARRAALVPFTLDPKLLSQFSALSGTSVDARVECNGQSFRENILLTHRGLSGPAILQISSYWRPGDTVTIDLLPDRNVFEHLKAAQVSHPMAQLNTLLAAFLSKKLSLRLCELWFSEFYQRSIAQVSDESLRLVAERLHHWEIKPSGTEGYRTAEVTAGGVSTDEISSKTFEAKKAPGLYFIGEVLDVTGQLGGFNFQWAWASGHAAGQYV